LGFESLPWHEKQIYFVLKVNLQGGLIKKQKITNFLTLSIVIYVIVSFVSPFLPQFGLVPSSLSPSNKITPLILTMVMQFARNGGFAYWLYMETRSLIWTLFAFVFGLPAVILFYVKEKLKI